MNAFRHYLYWAALPLPPAPADLPPLDPIEPEDPAAPPVEADDIAWDWSEEEQDAAQRRKLDILCVASGVATLMLAANASKEGYNDPIAWGSGMLVGGMARLCVTLLGQLLERRHHDV